MNKNYLPQQIPDLFWEKLHKVFPDQQTYNQVRSTFKTRPTTIRLNTLKDKPETILTKLKNQGFDFQQSSFSQLAYSLQNKSKSQLMETPEYERGDFYIQSYASQMPPLFMDLQPNQTVLDLTAAPGSKTSQIAALMQNQGELHANDVNKIRFFKLKHNLEKLSVIQPQSEPINQDESIRFCTLHKKHGAELCRQFPDEYFDRILLDAPCSGESRFIIDKPKTFQYWSKHKVKEMEQKQKKLLIPVWSKLKKGGILVYSTCTFSVEENEKIINYFLKKFPNQAEILTQEISGVQRVNSVLSYNNKDFDPQIQNTFRILPDDNIEGFFIAKIKKHA